MLEFWHTRVRRVPWLFHDRYGIVYQFRPGDSFAEHYDKRAALDDDAQRAYLERAIKPGMTVFDVGANIGGVSLLAARLMGNQGRLLAFEPDPDTFAALATNFLLNRLPPHFEAINAAVAAHTGTVTLHRFPRSSASWNSIARYEAHGITPSTTIDVDCFALDTLAHERGIKSIDLLKLDVEGAEPLVLAGAVGLLRERAVARVLFEISQVPLLGSGHTVNDVLAPLLTTGYALFAIDPDGQLRATSVQEIAATRFGNFVARAP